MSGMTIEQAWEALGGAALVLEVDAQDYTAGKLREAMATLRAEIDALRAEVTEWKRVASAQAELHGEADDRAERLAEALREAEKLLKRTPRATRDMYVDASPIGWGVQAGNVLAMIRAALAQEDRNG